MGKVARLNFVRCLRLAIRALCGAATIVSAMVASAEERVVFPLPKHSDRIYVTLTVGQSQHLCALSSSSSNNSFDLVMKPVLGRCVGSHSVQPSLGPSVSGDIFEGPVAKVGGFPVPTSLPAIALDYSDIDKATGRKIEGDLGMPMFCEYVIQVDFDKCTVELLPRDVEPNGDWGVKVPVAIVDSLPKIEVELNDCVKESFAVDTGTNTSVYIREKLFDELTERQAIIAGSGTLLMSTAGVIRPSAGRLSRIKCADFEHRNLLVTRGGTESGLGIGYLRRFRVTFDFGRGCMYLAKGATYASDDKALLGVGILRLNEKVTVVDVSTGSVAERAGLKEGDQLLSVAGNELKEGSMSEVAGTIRDSVDSAGNVAVSIRRTGEEKTISLHVDNQ